MGMLGLAAGGTFVRGDVEKIFNYRREVVPQILSNK
jgi:hypothetical protein